MGATVLVPVEEYLRTEYDPDVDYVDGLLEERHLGEYDHGRLQGALIAYLWGRRKELGIFVAPELRIQVAASRFRIPDVAVGIGTHPGEQVLTKPPLLCVEILSPEDRLPRMIVRIREYIDMGVKQVWLIDPQTRAAWTYGEDSRLLPVTDGVLRAAHVEVPLAALFED